MDSIWIISEIEIHGGSSTVLAVLNGEPSHEIIDLYFEEQRIAWASTEPCDSLDDYSKFYTISSDKHEVIDMLFHNGKAP